MDELIKKQDAIDVLRTCYDTETISMDNGDEYINYGDAVGGIEQLPSTQPTYTDAEIQKMQDLESAEIEKAYQLGYEEGKKNAEPYRKTAHWVLLDECSNSGYYCSKCCKKVAKEGWSSTVKKIKFCPNCGAKIQGVKKV